ncbi:hypothetical protein Tco_1245874 [Tanacetum coccineum]
MTLDIKLHEIADLVMKKYKCIVSHGQRRSAKRWALNEGENTMRDHYGYIRSYAKEILLESNDGSTVRVGVTMFKKPNFGEILVTIRRDGNNHIFPVTWVMVNVENKENWSWFLGLLGEDLDLPTRNGLTLISDQHKNAFSESLNVVLLRVRNKPPVTMLEAMRVIVMERMNTMRRMLDKWTNDICPNIQKRLELIKDQQSSQTAPIEEIPFKNQVVPVNEPIPQAKRNFVIPRQRERSERILKRKLAKDHPGTRNSRTNPHSLD